MKSKGKVRWVILGVLILCAAVVVLRGLNRPRYTAEVHLEVLSDPNDRTSGPGARGMLPKDLEYLDRLSVATWISSRRTYRMLLERPEIRATAWLAAQGSDSALEDLSRWCRATPHRYESRITISMQAKQAEDAELIANTLAAITVEALVQHAQETDPAEETGLPRVM
ncbi:MAG TPA: hypothetical protein ENN81_13500, partial [Phycisphaerales bacterium]|nr:hypothetical protein [Phycisphaerales bacterium]